MIQGNIAAFAGERLQLSLSLAGREAVAQAANGLVGEIRPGVVHVAGLEGNGNPELGIEVREVVSGGATPMISRLTPSRRMVRPMTLGSAPNCCFQNPLLRTMTRSWPSTASAEEKNRPSTGRTPSVSKRLVLTVLPKARAALPTPVTLNSVFIEYPETLARACERA
jgi:hypothetical protein